MTKTMEVTINENLYQQIEQAAHEMGLSISEFVQQLLRDSLREPTIAELERAEIEAYQRLPITPDEFDIWQNEQTWGEE